MSDCHQKGLTEWVSKGLRHTHVTKWGSKNTPASEGVKTKPPERMSEERFTGIHMVDCIKQLCTW